MADLKKIAEQFGQRAISSMGKKSSVKEIASTLGQKAVEALGLPQKKMLQKVAETIGVDGKKETSEDASTAIVEKLAEKLGIPETSQAGNVAKALGVAGLETFADPLGPLGKMGKLLKFTGKSAKAAKGALKLVQGAEQAHQVGADLAKPLVRGAEKMRFIGEQALPEGQKIIQKVSKTPNIAQLASRNEAAIDKLVRERAAIMYGPEIERAARDPQAMRAVQDKIAAVQKILKDKYTKQGK